MEALVFPCLTLKDHLGHSPCPVLHLGHCVKMLKASTYSDRQIQSRNQLSIKW